MKTSRNCKKFQFEENKITKIDNQQNLLEEINL